MGLGRSKVIPQGGGCGFGWGLVFVKYKDRFNPIKKLVPKEGEELRL